METRFCVILGVLIGCLYGITLWASLDAFSLASSILYRDEYIIPFVSTAVITLLTFALLFTWELWYGYAEQVLMQFVEGEDDEE